MCQNGFNSADFKLAIHQLAELSKLIKSGSEQWSRLADAQHQHELSKSLEQAGEKMAEVTALLEVAFEHAHNHDHSHIHIS